MHIYPAIDILGGKVVRLYQGDYALSEVYSDEPALIAEEFVKAGAKYLHIVDLDGAKAGAPRNFKLVGNLAVESGLFCEIGGGIRNVDMVERYLNAGIGRVILGTAALRDRPFVEAIVAQYGEKIAVGVDARDGKVAVDGWLDTSDTDSLDFCKQMWDIGVVNIIYTDISRDGAQNGTNLAVYEKLVARLEGVRITASGGVSTLEEIQALRDMGLYGVILGKALYTGKLDLAEAIKIAEITK